MRFLPVATSLLGLTVLLSACGTSSPQPTAQTAPAKLDSQVLGGGVGLTLDQYQSIQVTTPGFTNRFIRHIEGVANTDIVNAQSGDLLKRDATWKTVRGLADANCYSFESLNYPGQYLRHKLFRVRKDASDGSPTFKADATWCANPGLAGTGAAFESYNFRGSYMRHYAGQLWLARSGGPNFWDTANNFNQDTGWELRAPFATGTGGGGNTCTVQTWTRGVNYPLGTVVRFSNNQLYKVVNVGTNGSDGTDPTISTWYWQPTSDCGNPPPPPPPPSNGFVVSEAQYNQMFPNRIPYYNYSGFAAALSAWPAFATTGSDTTKRQEAAAFLANMHHESGGGQYVREINQANWPLYCSSGNCGGKQYYGRGPTQLSWDYNYKAAGDALGIDLLNNPDLVATDASVGWKTALWYWMTQRGGAPRTPHDAMVQGAGFGETIRAINGGLECNGAGEAQRTSRINLYTNFSSILGVPPGNNLGC
ncbi:AbfB domain-containing protein [Deinococcus sp.]|uniref:AbfB domain-containing protein n=1 Tax=Deinococcus sp. TaxID=47478 RepID=UPI003B58E07B